MVGGKGRPPGCPHFLASVSLYHHRTQETEQGLAFILGKASSRMGQLILHLSAMHSKAALLFIEATRLGTLSDTKTIWIENTWGSMWLVLSNPVSLRAYHSLGHSYGLNCVPPKHVEVLTLQYLCMKLYLEIESLKIQSSYGDVIVN